MNYKKFKEVIRKYNISNDDIQTITNFLVYKNAKTVASEIEIGNEYRKLLKEKSDCHIKIELDIDTHTIPQHLALKYLTLLTEGKV